MEHASIINRRAARTVLVGAVLAVALELCWHFATGAYRGSIATVPFAALFFVIPYLAGFGLFQLLPAARLTLPPWISALLLYALTSLAGGVYFYVVERTTSAFAPGEANAGAPLLGRGCFAALSFLLLSLAWRKPPASAPPAEPVCGRLSVPRDEEGRQETGGRMEGSRRE